MYTMQKQLGKDAELSAAEIVRRAERGIGLAIRRGQEIGEIRSKENTSLQGSCPVDRDAVSGIPSPHVVAGEAKTVLGDFYAITDNVSDEQFEEALLVAKDEGNLSRANVVKTVKVITDPETALRECRSLRIPRNMPH